MVLIEPEVYYPDLEASGSVVPWMVPSQSNERSGKDG